jgi:hypothetical protein
MEASSASEPERPIAEAQTKKKRIDCAPVGHNRQKINLIVSGLGTINEK